MRSHSHRGEQKGDRALCPPAERLEKADGYGRGQKSVPFSGVFSGAVWLYRIVTRWPDHMRSGSPGVEARELHSDCS